MPKINQDKKGNVMIKSISILGLFLALTFTANTNALPGGERVTTRLCTYSYALGMDGARFSYYSTEVPRNYSCPEAPDPVVYIEGDNVPEGYYETVEVEYLESNARTTLYKGATSEGEDCIVEVRSLLIAD